MTVEEAIRKGLLDPSKLDGPTLDLYTRLLKMTKNFTNISSKKEAAFKSLAKAVEKKYPNAIVHSEMLVDMDTKQSFDANQRAEFLIKDLSDNDRQPNEAELQELRLFSGYGGMERLGATGKGLLYEYYTPPSIVRKMWELAYLYGYSGGAILEPSAGPGRFLEFAPKNAQVVAYETNPIAAKICSLLYPNAEVILGEFEKRFIENNDTVRNKVEQEFDLVIGNPPYGEMGGIYAGMGEKSYTKARNYIDYFITRGLDVLKPNGLLIMIVGAEVAAGGKPWLAQEMDSKLKDNVAKKADLVDAYRLPNGVFERTDVLSEIVVFRKK